MNKKNKFFFSLKNFTNNKKSMIGDWIWWFFYISITAIIITIIVYIAGTFMGVQMETYNLEYDMISNRIVKSLSYINPDTQRLELGIIDLENFKEGNIKKNIAQEGIGVKTTLKGVGNNINKEIYYDKGFYEDYIFLSKTNQNVKKKIYVLVKDEEEVKGAVLEIDIIFSKERKLDEDG